MGFECCCRSNTGFENAANCVIKVIWRCLLLFVVLLNTSTKKKEIIYIHRVCFMGSDGTERGQSKHVFRATES